MVSQSHEWIDYNRVAFSIKLLGWDCTFLGDFGVRNFLHVGILKIGIFGGGGERHCKS